MKKYLIFIWLFTLILDLSGQNRIIYGKVQDEDLISLLGVTVIEKGTSNATMTLDNGTFKINIENDRNSALVFVYIGFQEKQIKLNDTLMLPLIVQLEPNEPTKFENSPKFKLNYSFLNIDFENQIFNFNRFKEFPSKDIDLFNQMFYTVQLGLSSYYKSFYGKFSFGINSDFYIKDSLKTSINLNKSIFSFGYGFHDRKNRIIFTPSLSFVRNNFKYFKYEELKKRLFQIICKQNICT